jgi:hypothetical protein
MTSATGGPLDIDFCQFVVPQVARDGNMSFTITYAFSVGEHGELRDIRMVQNDRVSEQDVIDCLTRWKVPVFPENSTGSVSFHWTHAIGWDKLILIGSDLELIVHLSGDRSPYRSTVASDSAAVQSREQPCGRESP